MPVDSCYVSRYMNTMVATENFPTELCSREAKEQFARAVLKERANKRKLQVYHSPVIVWTMALLQVGALMTNPITGNGARVFPPIKGSSWVRICSTIGPVGSLKQERPPTLFGRIKWPPMSIFKLMKYDCVVVNPPIVILTTMHKIPFFDWNWPYTLA